jgi:hypothetical protein
MSSQSYIFNPTERTLAAAGDGFSAPRLTTTDRLALSLGTNGKGMMVYDSTLTTLCLWNGTAWEFINDNTNFPFVSVKDYGAKGDGVTDDTAAIQAAFNSGYGIIFPNGNYKVSSTITIGAYQRIIGQSRTTTQITATTSAFVFEYLSPVPSGDIYSGIQINGITINAKNALKFNQSGANYNAQGAVLGIRITDCTLFGTYNDATDPDANTNIYPTEAFLLSQGTGIYGAKLFDCLIQTCIIRNFGMGIFFDACDVNNVDTCRLLANARHVHTKFHDNTGSQNKIQNCDILLNYRRGGIYDDGCRYTSIMNNYFETYSAAAEHYTGRLNDGTLFTFNRVDASGFATPIISSAPQDRGIEISQNRGGTSNTIEILSTNWTSTNQTLAKFLDNFPQWPETRYPQCFYSTFSSIRTWGPYSPKPLGGAKAATYPWTVSASGLPCISTVGAGGVISIAMETLESDLNLLITITGEPNGGAPGGFTVIRWGGVTVFSGDWFLVAGLTTMQRTIRKPDAVLANSGIIIELANNQGYFCGIEVDAVNYQLLNAAPVAGTWTVGSLVDRLTPTVGGPKGWMCTVSGTPGTWVSTGNL